MYSLILLTLGILLFVIMGHNLAKRKGLNPLFWGIMGGLFGPLILPFILLARPHKPDSEQD
jgi:hypothetical protein